MKKLTLTLTLAAIAPVAFAQVAETTTTTTTPASTSVTSTSSTMATGTITEFTPGEVITLRQESGPATYRFSESTTYVTKSGKTIPAAVARERIRVGAPVSVSYERDGDNMVASRVEIDDDGEVEVND